MWQENIKIWNENCKQINPNDKTRSLKIGEKISRTSREGHTRDKEATEWTPVVMLKTEISMSMNWKGSANNKIEEQQWLENNSSFCCCEKYDKQIFVSKEYRKNARYKMLPLKAWSLILLLVRTFEWSIIINPHVIWFQQFSMADSCMCKEENTMARWKLKFLTSVICAVNVST